MALKSFDENIHIRTQEDADRISASLESMDMQPLDLPTDFFDKLEEGRKHLGRCLRS